MGNSQSKQQSKEDKLEATKPITQENLKEVMTAIINQEKANEMKEKNAIIHQLEKELLAKNIKEKGLLLLGVLAIPFSLLTYTGVRRLISLRYMIQPKKYPTSDWPLTEYQKVLSEMLIYNSVRLDYLSLTGGQGIGKSSAILRLINQLSKKFPIFYIELKESGGNIQDKIKQAIKLPSKYNLSSHLRWSNTPLVPAFTFLRMQLQSLKFIRDHHKFSFMACLSPLAMPFIWMPALPFLQSSWFLAMHGPEVLYGSFAGLYLWGVYPILKYCWTRGIPTVVFDDANVMALNQDPLEVQKCANFYPIVLQKLANVVLLSSDSRTSQVLKKMPCSKNAIEQSVIIFDPQYTYQQILDDENKSDGTEGDFKKMKQTFMKQLFARDDIKKFLSNDAIRYFILELKDRELPLREFQHFFGYQDPISIHVFNEFKKKFQEEIQKKAFENEKQKQSKVKEIVKEVCKIYDHHQKARIATVMVSIWVLYPLERRQKMNLLIQSLGVEAQSAEMKLFEMNSSYVQLYFLFIQKNILKQEGPFISFESKMNKIAFNLWFEENGLKSIEIDELKMKKLAEKNEKTP